MKDPELDVMTEWRYRRDERLGIMCEGQPPTPRQVEIARQEADEWLARYEEETENNEPK